MTKVSPTRPREPRTAFVLSGGGNQGVSQVGMLRALMERAIEPDVIIGTSVGALNGAVVATSPALPQIEHLESVWQGLTGDQVFPGGAWRRAWNLVRRDDHIISNDGLQSVLSEALIAENFGDLKVPLRVVAADLETGTEFVFASGPVRPCSWRARRFRASFRPSGWAMPCWSTVRW